MRKYFKIIITFIYFINSVSSNYFEFKYFIGRFIY